MRMIPLLTALLLMAPAFAQTRAEPEDATDFAAKPIMAAQKHMIVAASPLAAQAGDRIMAGGGSAADAAILVLNVVESQSSGIGGGAGGVALLEMFLAFQSLGDRPRWCGRPMSWFVPPRGIGGHNLFSRDNRLTGR